MKSLAVTIGTATLLLATFGSTESAQASEKYMAEIVMTGTNFCPRYTLPADGRLMEIASNSALFSLLGTMYGGDGRTTFGLPDLRPVDDDGERVNFKTLRYCVVTEGLYPSRS